MFAHTKIDWFTVEWSSATLERFDGEKSLYVTSWPRRSPVLPVLLQDLQSSRPSSHSWNMRSSGSRWHWIPHLLLAGLVAKTWIRVEVKLQEHRISAGQGDSLPTSYLQKPITAITPIPPKTWPGSPNPTPPTSGRFTLTFFGRHRAFHLLGFVDLAWYLATGCIQSQTSWALTQMKTFAEGWHDDKWWIYET